MWWQALLTGLGGLLLVWLLLVGLLWRIQRRIPGSARLGSAIRLLPDVIRLLSRLAADPALPRGIRVRLWLALTYLLLPVDLVPDLIPVIGYADDALVMVWALRSATRAAGPDALARHWPGPPEGLDAVRHLAGLGRQPSPTPSPDSGASA